MIKTQTLKNLQVNCISSKPTTFVLKKEKHCLKMKRQRKLEDIICKSHIWYGIRTQILKRNWKTHSSAIRRKKDFNLKNRQKIWTDISPEKLYGTNKHINIFSTSLVIRNIQIQTTRCCHIPFRVAKTEKTGWELLVSISSCNHAVLVRIKNGAPALENISWS